MAPFLIPLFIALVSAMGTFQQLEAKRRQQEHQADVMRANALAKEQQAEIVRAKGELQRRAVDREKIDAKRKYRAQAGMNIAMLNNVDFSSGSPLAMMEGNLNRFADDMGEFEYKKDLVSWETGRASDVKEWEADVMGSQASFLDRTAGSLGKSLLMSGLQGTASYFGAKSMIGGGGAAAAATAAPAAPASTGGGYSAATFSRQIR